MRIAIISDIHGNLPALEAILADLHAQEVEQIVCLGDVAAFGPQPCEVLTRLRALDCPVVMGNTDEWLLNPTPHEARDENSQRVTEVEMWSARQLSAGDLDYLRSFCPTIELSLDGGATLLCFHGSPQSPIDVILPTTPDAGLERMLADCQATVMAGGHTHAQMLRRYGEAALINPGSAGLPYERDLITGRARNPARAEYGIVGWERGTLAVEFRRVPFDVRELVRTALDSGMPHARWWAKDWVQGGNL